MISLKSVARWAEDEKVATRVRGHYRRRCVFRGRNYLIDWGTERSPLAPKYRRK